MVCQSIVQLHISIDQSIYILLFEVIDICICRSGGAASDRDISYERTDVVQYARARAESIAIDAFVRVHTDDTESARHNRRQGSFTCFGRS